MRYEIHGEAVIFYVNNPKRELEDTRSASFARTGLTPVQITPMLDATVAWKRGQALATQTNASRLLVAVFEAFRAKGSSWPRNSQNWTLFLLWFFQWFLSDTESSSAKIHVRTEVWGSHFVPWFECLKNAEVIPMDVVIPRIQKKMLISADPNVQPLLGKGGGPLILSATPAQKLLVDVNFGLTDADYLDSVEQQCRHLVSVIKEVCLLHWRGLMKDAKTGRDLAALVSDEMIDQAMAEGRFGEIVRTGRICQMRNFVRFASATHPQGISWALAWVRHTLKNGRAGDCVSAATIRSSAFFNSYSTFRGDLCGTYPVLDGLTSMSREQWQQLKSPNRFYRFAGMLSALDAAAACALLSIEHPQFTAESLRNAMLLNVRGKPRLLLTDIAERSILCIDKPRAGKLKSAVLSAETQEIVHDIIRSTASVREVLKRAGDKRWRFLLLGVSLDRGVGKLSVLHAGPSYLNGNISHLSLSRLYPVLGQNGLGSGTFDYRRLRNTMGVLRWFDTGSILEMSRKLGNTRKVALEHYLPPALLRAWNTRVIRRFQNTLIALAAHDEPYLLEVTDFSNLVELQHFIAQLILDYPTNTSPLADEVQRRLGGASQSRSVASASAPGFLNVRLSPKSLAYLYAFRDLAQMTLTPQQLDRVDALSGLSPRQFIDMARLLTHAAENTELHPALRDSLDVTRLMECHGQAKALKAEIDVRFSKLVLKRDWEEV